MVEELAPERLVESEDPPTVVDVRDERRFRDGHVPGALNVPLPALSTRIDGLGVGGEVAFVCPHGKSSRRAAAFLERRREDLTAYNVTGGYAAYDGPLAEGDPGAGESEPDDDTDEGPSPDAPF
jgi:rhodanese-related sulfurtransferase